MAAPTATDRITPTGRKLGAGAPAYITFASNPDISLWEQNPTPPGFTLDDKKDNTTSFNNDVRTFSPGRLRTGDDITCDCGYDPDDLQEIYDLVGLRDTITVTFPSGTQVAFYGWLNQVSFNGLSEDDDPMVSLTICQGNQDWDTCVEQPPVVYPGTGTSPTC